MVDAVRRADCPDYWGDGRRKYSLDDCLLFLPYLCSGSRIDGAEPGCLGVIVLPGRTDSKYAVTGLQCNRGNAGNYYGEFRAGPLGALAAHFHGYCRLEYRSRPTIARRD